MKPEPYPTLDIQWHTGEQVGQVVNPGRQVFGYVPQWLTSGVNLSPLVVPFSEQVHRVRQDAFDQLPGFLADCLPDNWGRTIMEREFAAAGLKVSPMHMLAWVGNRGIGALNFHPSQQLENPSKAWAPVQPILLAREAQAVMQKSPPEAFENLRRAGTAGGAFPKATVAHLPDGSFLCGGNVSSTLQLHPQARLGILKLDVEDAPTRPRTDGRLEMAYLDMAKQAGINVAQATVISHADELRPRHHLFVERFDILDQGSRRLHMLSLAGALETFNRLTYLQLLDVTRRLTEDHQQVREAVRRMVFNVRSANADDHGKNHAFTLDRATARWSLSPAYDLTLNYSESSHYHGLFPTTFGDQPTLERMQEIAAEFSVTETDFLQINEDVERAVGRWLEIAETHAVPETDRVRAQHQQERIRTILGRAPSPTVRRRTRRKRW